MEHLDHERLDVHRVSVEFVVLADGIVEQLPRGRGYIADQLRRAATSIPLDIAEGVGEFSSREKARFYRMAKRSSTECAAIIDVCRELEVLELSLFEAGRQLLLRIVAMLIKLARRLSGTDSGTGSGTGTGT